MKDNIVGGKTLVVAISAGMLLGIGFLALTFVQGTAFDDSHRPTVSDCSVDSSGDITGGCTVHPDNIRDEYGGDWSRGDSFYVVIDDIEPTGDSHAPQTYYLFQNGFISEDVDEEDRNDFSQLHLTYGAFVWNSDIETSLKDGSICKGTMEIGSPGGVTFTYEDSSGDQHDVYYNDEPDSNERPIDNLMSSTEVEAESITFSGSVMACEFKVEDALDNNEHGGKFVSWSGRHPTFDGGDDGGSLSMSVDFNMAPQINQVGLGSENVSVGESLQATVSYSDPDGNVDVNWSNGATSDTVSYTFDEAGEKTVAVTVSDGTASTTASGTVVVEEREIIEDPEQPDDNETSTGGNESSGGDGDTGTGISEWVTWVQDNQGIVVGSVIAVVLAGLGLIWAVSGGSRRKKRSVRGYRQ